MHIPRPIPFCICRSIAVSKTAYIIAAKFIAIVQDSMLRAATESLNVSVNIKMTALSEIAYNPVDNGRPNNNKYRKYCLEILINIERDSI